MPQAGSNSVTGWLHAVRSGDDQAATQLWERYYRRLLSLARKRLVHDAEYDDEDLAVSVFQSFFTNLKDGDYKLDDRDGFWSLLVVMTVRKANDRRKRVQAAKRQIPGQCVDSGEAVAVGPTPDLAVMMAEQCKAMLQQLADPELEKVALLKLDGYSNPEIASELDCSVRSVGRMMSLIRTIWEARGRDESM